MMVAFHLCYDFTNVGWAHFKMLEDPFWLIWRGFIVSSFVFLAGISLSLSQQASTRSAVQRLLQLTLCAALVSLVTYVMFRERFIYFGVLHFFVVATLITRPLLRYPSALGVVGMLLLVAGAAPGFDVMNPRTLNWIGLASQKPFTEDYAPLIPWLGLLWVGVWVGTRWPVKAVLASAHRAASATILQPIPRGLGFLGQHSLIIYMVHQPLLLGGLLLLQ
jgi:uncharacterized membrane protein